MIDARRGTLLGMVLAVTLPSFTGCTGAAERDAQAERRDMVARHLREGEAGTRTLPPSPATVGLPAIPPDFSPWWAEPVQKPLFPASSAKRHDLEQLLDAALLHSSQIKVFSDIPLIRETGIQEAEGIFDVRAFVDGKYERLRKPVGSLLVSEEQTQFNQIVKTGEIGLRRKVETGADVTLSQRLEQDRSNSEFLAPNPQVVSTLTLSMVQPLLRGRGATYNTSTIRIARIDSEMAQSEFLRQAQSHLMEVARAYWALYLTRAQYLLEEKLVRDTAAVVERIEKRQDIDAYQSQLARARAAMTARKAEMVRSEMAIHNGEDRIRALVNNPEYAELGAVEFIPDRAPRTAEVDLDPERCAAIALERRPEIDQGFGNLRALAIREDMARNELMPRLNLIVEGHLRGLAKDNHTSQALDEQFDNAGGLVGLSFEHALGNNEAEARLKRRRIEVRQQLLQIQTTMDTVLLEVKVALRDARTAYREMQAKHEAMTAAAEDLSTLESRWGLDVVDQGRGGGAYLQFLLDSQERLARAETGLLQSSVAYEVALINLERAKGTLLAYNEVTLERSEDPTGLPSLGLRRTPSGEAPADPPPSSTCDAANGPSPTPPTTR